MASDETDAAEADAPFIELRQLQLEARTALPGAVRLPNRHDKLIASDSLAASSRFGFVAFAGGEGVGVALTAPLLEAVRSAKPRSAVPPPPAASARTASVAEGGASSDASASAVRICADGRTIVVVVAVAAATAPQVAALDAALALAPEPKPAVFATLQASSKDDDKVVNVLPRPAPPSSAAFDVAVLCANGRVRIASIPSAAAAAAASAPQPLSSHPLASIDAFVSSICWTPSGSRIACGTKSGSIHIVKPAPAGSVPGSAAVVRQIPLPPSLAASVADADPADPKPAVQNLFFVNDDTLIVVYSTASSQPNDDPESEPEPPINDVYVVLIGDALSFVRLSDPAPASFSSGGRPQRYHFAQLDAWGTSSPSFKHLVIVASTTSTDVGVIACTPSGEWCNWIISEKYPLTMPLDKDDQDTWPIGIAIDFSSTSNLPPPTPDLKEIPATPILLILTNVGELIACNIVNTRESSPHPHMVRQTESLPRVDTPAVKHTTTASAAAAAPSKTPAASDAEPTAETSSTPTQANPFTHARPKASAFGSAPFAPSFGSKSPFGMPSTTTAATSPASGSTGFTFGAFGGSAKPTTSDTPAAASRPPFSFVSASQNPSNLSDKAPPAQTSSDGAKNAPAPTKMLSFGKPSLTTEATTAATLATTDTTSKSIFGASVATKSVFGGASTFETSSKPSTFQPTTRPSAEVAPAVAPSAAKTSTKPLAQKKSDPTAAAAATSKQVKPKSQAAAEQKFEKQPSKIKGPDPNILLDKFDKLYMSVVADFEHVDKFSQNMALEFEKALTPRASPTSMGLLGSESEPTPSLGDVSLVRAETKFLMSKLHQAAEPLKHAMESIESLLAKIDSADARKGMSQRCIDMLTDETKSTVLPAVDEQYLGPETQVLANQVSAKTQRIQDMLSSAQDAVRAYHAQIEQDLRSVIERPKVSDWPSICASVSQITRAAMEKITMLHTLDKEVDKLRLFYNIPLDQSRVDPSATSRKNLRVDSIMPLADSTGIKTVSSLATPVARTPTNQPAPPFSTTATASKLSKPSTNRFGLTDDDIYADDSVLCPPTHVTAVKSASRHTGVDSATVNDGGDSTTAGVVDNQTLIAYRRAALELRANLRLALSHPDRTVPLHRTMAHREPPKELLRKAITHPERVDVQHADAVTTPEPDDDDDETGSPVRSVKSPAPATAVQAGSLFGVAANAPIANFGAPISIPKVLHVSDMAKKTDTTAISSTKVVSKPVVTAAAASSSLSSSNPPNAFSFALPKQTPTQTPAPFVFGTSVSQTMTSSSSDISNGGDGGVKRATPNAFSFGVAAASSVAGTAIVDTAVVDVGRVSQPDRALSRQSEKSESEYDGNDEGDEVEGDHQISASEEENGEEDDEDVEGEVNDGDDVEGEVNDEDYDEDDDDADDWDSYDETNKSGDVSRFDERSKEEEDAEFDEFLREEDVSGGKIKLLTDNEDDDGGDSDAVKQPPSASKSGVSLSAMAPPPPPPPPSSETTAPKTGFNIGSGKFGGFAPPSSTLASGTTANSVFSSSLLSQSKTPGSATTTTATTTTSLFSAMASTTVPSFMSTPLATTATVAAPVFGAMSMPSASTAASPGNLFASMSKPLVSSTSSVFGAASLSSIKTPTGFGAFAAQTASTVSDKSRVSIFDPSATGTAGSGSLDRKHESASAIDMKRDTGSVSPVKDDAKVSPQKGLSASSPMQRPDGVVKTEPSDASHVDVSGTTQQQQIKQEVDTRDDSVVVETDGDDKPFKGVDSDGGHVVTTSTATDGATGSAKLTQPGPITTTSKAAAVTSRPVDAQTDVISTQPVSTTSVLSSITTPTQQPQSTVAPPVTTPVKAPTTTTTSSFQPRVQDDQDAFELVNRSDGMSDDDDDGMSDPDMTHSALVSEEPGAPAAVMTTGPVSACTPTTTKTTMMTGVPTLDTFGSTSFFGAASQSESSGFGGMGQTAMVSKAVPAGGVFGAVASTPVSKSLLPVVAASSSMLTPTRPPTQPSTLASTGGFGAFSSFGGDSGSAQQQQRQSSPTGAVFGQTGSVFGGTVSTTASTGMPLASGVVTTTTAAAAGVVTTTTPMTSSFGQSAFGQSSFGQSSFGQSSFGQPAFGQSSFGQSSFGQSSFGQSSFGQSSFGQSSFGNTGARVGGVAVSNLRDAPLFGSSVNTGSNAPSFGSFAAVSGVNTNGGGSGSGAGAASFAALAATPTTSAFGQSSASGQSSAFGQSSVFGQLASGQQSVFGQSASGQSAFGSSASGQSAFGSSASGQQSAFGQSASCQPSAFGSSASGQPSAFSQPSTFGQASVFGNVNSGTTGASTSFLQQQQQQQQQPNKFGDGNKAAFSEFRG